MAPTEPVVEVTDVKGGDKAQIGMTVAEGQEAKPAAGPTAESIGVTQEQFDKFHKDGVYNWEAHAKEAEFKAGQKAEAKPDDKTAKDEAESKEIDPEAAAKDAGLDWDALKDKVIAKGDIDESDYAALTKIGVPEEIAGEYIDAIYAKAQSHYDEITGMFGGAEQLKETVNKLVKAGAYTEADRAMLAEKLSDPREAKITANTLLQQAGMKAKTFRGNNSTTPSSEAVEGYASQAEMVSDMRDPRYKKDAAFRANVTAKARAATFDDNPRRHVGGL
jgi:hypothetical protein